jgi:hypothetical protein
MVESSEPSIHVLIGNDETKVKPTEPDLTCEVSNRDNLPFFRPEMGSQVFPSPSALPQIKIATPFSVTSSKIIETFVKAASKKRFQVIEQSNSMATAVFKEQLNFKDLLLCCLPAERRSRGVVSAVRLHIAVNEVKCIRVVLVKGLYGSPQNIMPLIEEFRSKLQLTIDSADPVVIPTPHKQYEPLSDRCYDEDPEQEGQPITCKDETSSYYEFHKILSSESYTLGKSLSEFFASFMSQYRNLEESASLLPQPVRPT